MFCFVYIQCQIDNFNIKSKPGLPIFSTVSAAALIPRNEIEQLAPVTRVGQIMKFGFPSLDNIRSFDDYILSYDRKTRTANWVFEHLTPSHVQHNDAVDRSKSDFKADESIHHFFRADNNDYKRSGYDRGHLAAAGNHKRSQRHLDQTFFLSNISPQVGKGFNRDSWNRLERHVRKLTKVYPSVYVCTGPLYLPRKEADGKLYVKYEVIGEKNVAVPTHFFKVIVCEAPNGVLTMESYVMPNQVIADDTSLDSFKVPPESIERAAGLLFFDGINRKSLKAINGKGV